MKYSSETLKAEDTEQKVTIKAKESVTVYFKNEAPKSKQSGGHKFTIQAKGEKLEDTVSDVINITPNDTYEAVATADYSTDPAVNEYIYIPNNITKAPPSENNM